jgi:hypothetical protein
MTVLSRSRWATAQDYQRERGFSESAEGLALGLALGAVSGTVVDSTGAGSATGGTTASGVLGSAGGLVEPQARGDTSGGVPFRVNPVVRSGSGKTFQSRWSPLYQG